MSRVLQVIKYLIPKKGRWRVRTFLLFAFILFDYAITLAFCSNPTQEGNIFVRQFMEIYGIFLGLTIYDLINNLPIYMVLCVVSYLVNLSTRLSKIIEPFVDLVFAWFVAGAHFDGAASWFWPIAPLMRQIVGAILYLILALLLFTETRSFLVNLFKTQKTAGTFVVCSRMIHTNSLIIRLSTYF